ncbi:MAG: hypothetical protein ACYDG2_22960 [Ruminiclostridium sp.]
MKNTLDRKFVENLKKYSKHIKVNDIDNVAFFKENENKDAEDIKYMFTSVGVTKQGDLIDALNAKWLVISQADNIHGTYDKSVIQKVEYTVNFNFTGTIRSFPAIFYTKVMDINTGTYISTASNKVVVTLQNNVDSRDLALNMKFINTGRAWKITGIDRSGIGLLTLSCDLDYTASTDDLNNEIIDRWKYETAHAYLLTISNGETMEVPLNDIAQVNVTVTDNGTIMTTLPPLTFLTSNSNVVAIDNTGKLMGISAGMATITAKMTYNTSIFDTITVIVVENVNHLFTMSITGNATIKANRSDSYVAHVFDNGMEVFDKTAIWSIRNQDGTGTLYATITASTGNGATVKAGSTYPKYVILKATASDDSALFAEFTIRTVSLI